MCKYKLNKTQIEIKIKGRKKKWKSLKGYLKAKAPRLIFYHSLQSNLSQFNKIVISNLKLKGFGPEKVPIK